MYTFILLSILFISCSPLNELRHWDDKEFKTLSPNTKKSYSEEILIAPFPNMGIYKGIAKRLEEKPVKNKKEIKHINWVNGAYIYDVFLYQKDDKKWYVLDAIKWHKNIKF